MRCFVLCMYFYQHCQLICCFVIIHVLFVYYLCLTHVLSAAFYLVCTFVSVVLYSQYSYVLSSALPTSRLPSTCMHFHQYCLLMSCFFPSTVCPFVSIVLALPTNFVLCTFVCSFISTLHVVKYFVSNLTHQRLFQFTIFGFRVSWIHSTLKETVSQTYNPLVILIFSIFTLGTLSLKHSLMFIQFLHCESNCFVVYVQLHCPPNYSVVYTVQCMSY